MRSSAITEKALFHKVFDLGGNCLHFFAGDQSLFNEATKYLNFPGYPGSEEGIKLVLRRDAAPPVPGDARHIHSGCGEEHFFSNGRWWIKREGLTLLIDREAETVSGFSDTNRFEGPPLLGECLIHPVFELLRRRGLFLTHAAAVSLEGSGILLPGEAGAGKTTLSLHLMARRARFLSDDRCFLRRKASGFEMLPLLEPVRVYPPNIAGLAPFRFLPENDVCRGTKQSFNMKELAPDSLRDRAELKAVIFPGWEPESKSYLETVSPSEAMKKLLPSAIEFFFPDTASDNFALVGDIVAKIPCFRLHLGSDRESWYQLARQAIR